MDSINKRSLIFSGLLFTAIALFWTEKSNADLVFDFTEESSGSVLATIELSGLPATHVDVVEFLITDAGLIAFNLPSGFSPVFDQTLGSAASSLIVTDGIDGLGGNGLAGGETFLIDSTNSFNVLFFQGQDIVDGVVGTFSATTVPEPSSIYILALALPYLALRRKCRHC